MLDRGEGSPAETTVRARARVGPCRARGVRAGRHGLERPATARRLEDRLDEVWIDEALTGSSAPYGSQGERAFPRKCWKSRTLEQGTEPAYILRVKLSLLFVSVAAVASIACVGCASPAPNEDSAAQASAWTATDLPPATKSAQVIELDALVTAINGYASADAYILEHPRDYDDTLDTSSLERGDPRCAGTQMNEAQVRDVTRERATGRVRKLGMTWSGQRGDVHRTAHETYHYDAVGRLRVVVVDLEEDHSLDDAFMAEVDSHNERVQAEHRLLPFSTEAEQIAVARKARELRDAEVITQYRVYFGTDGAKIYETVRAGLERSRELDYQGAIDNVPPVLYGSLHPANVQGEPILVRLYPTPAYSMRALPELQLTAADSIVSSLSATNAFDAEAALAAAPACK